MSGDCWWFAIVGTYPWVSSTSVDLTVILENKMPAIRITQVEYRFEHVF